MNEYIIRETGSPGTITQEIVGELVRCKDCKWLVTKEKTGFHLCGLEKFETMRDLTDFCSMGERKDSDV